MLNQKILKDKILVIQGLYNQEEFNEALKLCQDDDVHHKN